MTDATQISQHLPALPGARETDSPAPSIGSMLASPSAAADFLAALPARVGDGLLAQVDAIASAPLPALPPCPPDHFAKFLRAIAILPRKGDDDDTGEHRAKLYARTLGHMPADAIGYLTRRVLETCRWFPSIAECLDIAKGWKRDDEAVDVKSAAWRVAENERAARLEDLAARLRAAVEGKGRFAQAEIDAMPDRLKHRLSDMMLLWRLPSGRYSLRAGSWADAVAADGGGEAQAA